MALLTETDIAWLQGPVSILVASANATRVPSLAVGLGVRVAADGRALTVLVLDTTSHALLAHVRAGRAVAIAFTHSASTRSLQLKAPRAVIGSVSVDDAGRMDAYATAIAREWQANGQPAEFGHAFLVRAPGRVVALDVVPDQLFDQSPGPHAGRSR